MTRARSWHGSGPLVEIFIRLKQHFPSAAWKTLLMSSIKGRHCSGGHSMGVERRPLGRLLSAAPRRLKSSGSRRESPAGSRVPGLRIQAAACRHHRQETLENPCARIRVAAQSNDSAGSAPKESATRKRPELCPGSTWAKRNRLSSRTPITRCARVCDPRSARSHARAAPQERRADRRDHARPELARRTWSPSAR